jgi:beta-glucosidase
VTLALTALPGRAVATAAVPDASPRDASCPWLDTSLTVDQRVSELVAAMTLDQKISLMQIEAGSGAFAGYQTFIPPIPGLCVPALVLEDDSAGVANGTAGVTQLPAPIAAASTFDTGVLHDYGAVIGGEMSGKGINDALAPTVNLVRVPQWGRAFESLGEDPYLTTKLGDADIEGIQSQGVIADVKHYAEYNQEANRTPSLGLDNVVASERTLQETELAIFGSAVQDAHADAVMCAFPAVNGTLACEDPYLLQTVLRGQFGFKGDIRADNPAPVSDEVKAANAGLDQTRTPFFGASSLARSARPPSTTPPPPSSTACSRPGCSTTAPPAPSTRTCPPPSTSRSPATPPSAVPYCCATSTAPSRSAPATCTRSRSSGRTRTGTRKPPAVAAATSSPATW